MLAYEYAEQQQMSRAEMSRDDIVKVKQILDSKVEKGSIIVPFQSLFVITLSFWNTFCSGWPML